MAEKGEVWGRGYGGVAGLLAHASDDDEDDDAARDWSPPPHPTTAALALDSPVGEFGMQVVCPSCDAKCTVDNILQCRLCNDHMCMACANSDWMTKCPAPHCRVKPGRPKCPCEKVWCQSCGTDWCCDECGEDDALDTCATCEERSCVDCLDECDDCHASVCEDCRIVCYTCDNTWCEASEKPMQRCGMCDTSHCVQCLTMSTTNGHHSNLCAPCWPKWVMQFITIQLV